MRAFLFTPFSPPKCLSGYHHILPEDHLIAVDGGLACINALGKTPTLLIGDMDSVDRHLLEKYRHIPLIEYASEKNETDTELALSWCINQGSYDEIIILNDLQGRFDHCLGLLQNLLYLKKQAPKLSARLESQSQVLFFLDKTTLLQGKKGATLSLIAQGGMAEIESYKGLKYSLQGLKLYPHLSRGISNEITQDEAEIVVKSGDILAILTVQTDLA